MSHAVKNGAKVINLSLGSPPGGLLSRAYMKIYGDLRQDIGNTLAGRLGQIFAEAYEAENGRRGGSG